MASFLCDSAVTSRSAHPHGPTHGPKSFAVFAARVTNRSPRQQCRRCKIFWYEAKNAFYIGRIAGRWTSAGGEKVRKKMREKKAIKKTDLGRNVEIYFQNKKEGKKMGTENDIMKGRRKKQVLKGWRVAKREVHGVGGTNSKDSD